MCLHPLMIDNPYRGLAHVGLNRFHDCSSLKIAVPCGNCPDCIALRQSYFVQRTQMEALNHHLFMGTLTYDNDHLPYMIIMNDRFAYPRLKHFQDMVKRFRNDGHFDGCKYMCVSEYGGNKHRPHFHFILSVPKNKDDSYVEIMNLERKFYKLFFNCWKVNVGSRRKPIYQPLFTYHANSRGANFDFHYIDPSSTLHGESDVAFYVTKYILKCDKWLDKYKSKLKINLPPDEFDRIWKLIKPRMLVSKSWGSPDDFDVATYIRKCIDMSISNNQPYPSFFNPITGSSGPMSRYYQKRFLTVDDLQKFFDAKGLDTIDNISEIAHYDPAQVRFALHRMSKLKDMRDNANSSYNEFLDYVSENQNFSTEVQETDFDRLDRFIGSLDDFESGFNDFG